jgi:alpha-amylase
MPGMPDILFIFEVHQPFRLRKDFFWAKRSHRRVNNAGLFDHYFDAQADREVFERASKKCYLPSNRILLDQIDRHKREKRRARFSFSLSGVFLEQCERFGKDVYESFRDLARTGEVEFLGQTYYHSLCSLYPEKAEFREQVKQHRETVRELLGCTVTTFENTELIYNNAIAKTVEDLGFDAICTEGAPRILKEASPNQLYGAAGSPRLKVLLRNYVLTDDIGFRFSSTSWSEYPLTAEKYAGWLSATKGPYVCVFPDYETFGEHHWPETGIHGFLRQLPDEILKFENLRMATPAEVISANQPTATLDVPEPETISWADIERATSSWIGNTLQWAYYTSVRDLEPLVKESRDRELARLWRCFGISDHLYYMFTSGGGPGAVHSYFSPYSSPLDAFVASQAAVSDFGDRVRAVTSAASEPFMFHSAEGEKGYLGMMAWTLDGFLEALSRVPLESIEFHLGRGDFEAWARNSLGDASLAVGISKLRKSHAVRTRIRPGLRRLVRLRLAERKKLRRDLGFP